MVLKELYWEPLGVSVTHVVKTLGVNRKPLSSFLNGRAGISREMAVCPSIAFDTTAESWMKQQLRYDPWHAEQHRSKLKVVPLTASQGNSPNQ